MNRWNDFCDAVSAINSSEFFEEYYPEVAKRFHNDEYQEYVVEEITAAIKAGLDPTKCIDDVVTINLQSPRYALESIDIMIDAIDKLMNIGGKFPFRKLFEQECPYIEEETSNYEIRAKFIDHLKPETDIKWSDIKMLYWEDMKNINERFGYLKYCSKYLQTL